MKNPLASIMQQAQKMQDNFKQAQEELAAIEVQGESGGGLVTIIMNGKREARKVSIDPSLVGDDKDMLEDMVAAAINDAAHKVNKVKKRKKCQKSPLACLYHLAFKCHSNDAQSRLSQRINPKPVLLTGRWHQISPAYGVSFIAAQSRRWTAIKPNSWPSDA